MATFRVTDPNTNKTIRITGDSPPTERELEEIFSQVGGVERPQEPLAPERRVGGVFGVGSVPESEFQAGGRNILGKAFEVPGAAVRAGVRALAPGGETPREAFTRGAVRPGTVPTFQEQALDIGQEAISKRALKRKGFLRPDKPLGRALVFGESAVLGQQTSSLGLIADVVANPADLLLLISGKTPLGKGRTLAGQVGQTRAAKAVGRFATKERAIPGSKAIKNFKRAIKNVKDPAALADKVQNTVIQERRSLAKNITDKIDDFTRKNPEVTADFVDKFDDLKSLKANPELDIVNKDLATVIRRTKSERLAQLVKNPENAKALTMREAQNIKNAIEFDKSISRKFNKKTFDFSPGEQELLDLVDEIKVIQTDLIPGLQADRNAFKAFMDNWRVLKGKFREGVLVSKLKGSFGDEQIARRIAKTLPDDLMKEIGGFRGLIKFIKFSKVAGGIAGGTAVATGIGRAIFGGR